MRLLAPALLLLLLPSVARADGADDADRLFREGQQAMVAKDYSTACARFAASLQLQPGIGTRLWLADCYEKGGRLASAWHVFREAAAAATEAHDTRAEVASSRAAALEPKLARITVQLGALQPTEMRLDGVRIAKDEWTLPVFVDRGRHELRVVVEGRDPIVRAIDVGEDGRAYDVDLRPPAGAPPTQPKTVMLTPRPAESSTRAVVGWSLIGAGVVGVGLGTYFGLHAKTLYDDAAPHCPSSCDDVGYDQRRSAFHFATGSTIAFVAGGVSAAAGVTLLVLQPRRDAVASGWSLRVGAGSLSLGGAF